MKNLSKPSIFGTWLLYALVAVAAFQLTNGLHHAAEIPEVITKLGKLRGKTITQGAVSLNAYLSIPYAKPPLGQLRFKRPEAASSWTGTRNATQLPPACPQYSPSPFPWNYNNSKEQSEDCLYLNVWVPSPSTKQRAVMFWIHGGGFTLGASRDPLYDARTLAVTGDVVVVTINYRLGGLGFFYSGSEDAPGNAGLYDILMALKWVNENIQAFNGDKNRITIFGESAGAMAVGYLSLSSLAKGLYKRVIIESGSPLSLGDGKNSNLDLGQETAKRLGCANNIKTLRTNPKEVISCLKSVSAFDIVKVVGQLRPHSSTSFLPTFGDPIVGLNPTQAVKQRRFHDADVLIGCTRDEGSFIVTTDQPSIFGFFGEKDTFLNKTLAETLLRNYGARMPDIGKIVDHYLGHFKMDDGTMIQKELYNAVGDIVLICPTVIYAEKSAAANQNTYFYSYEHRSSLTPWAPLMGVAHFEELQFVFGKPTQQAGGYSTAELFFSKRMMRIWSDFAKTGNPEFGWPRFSQNNPMVRTLDVAQGRFDKESPYRKNCDYLRPYFDRLD